MLLFIWRIYQFSQPSVTFCNTNTSCTLGKALFLPPKNLHISLRMASFMWFLIRLSVCIHLSHITPSLSQDTVLGSHRPILPEPLLLPGVVPDFARCLLSSSSVHQPSAYWRKSEWNTAEQINIHREGMWGIYSHTAWMLGSFMCDRRGKSKWKVQASEGQQLGPFDQPIQNTPGKNQRGFLSQRWD